MWGKSFSDRALTRMVSVTHPSIPLAPRSASFRIEPPRGLFELRLREVWAYRELLYFFVWRDVKTRYEQTAIVVLWVVIQPVLTMFFELAADLTRRDNPCVPEINGLP